MPPFSRPARRSGGLGPAASVARACRASVCRFRTSWYQTMMGCFALYPCGCRCSRPQRSTAGGASWASRVPSPPRYARVEPYSSLSVTDFCYPGAAVYDRDRRRAAAHHRRRADIQLAAESRQPAGPHPRVALLELLCGAFLLSWRPPHRLWGRQ